MHSSNNKVSDPKVAQAVTQRLASGGLRAPSRVVVTSVNGQVTLSGVVQYDHQRQSALRATRGVNGVLRIVDMMKLIATPKRN